MRSIGSYGRKSGWLAAVAGAAVLVTGAGGAVASSANGSPVSAAEAKGSSVRATAAAVRVVEPGERIAVEGSELWLKAEGLHVVAPKVTDDLEVVEVSDVPPGKVSTLAWGDVTGVLYAGVYRGPVTATAKVTIKIGARTLQAEVVALAGNPGWGAYYAFDTKADASVKPSITVQN